MQEEAEMKKARDLYDADDNDPYFCVFDYQPILDAFGEILLQVDDADYQGDSRVLYRFDDGTYGYLQFGWGSCSGCDALQACRNYDEVDELIADLYHSIKRFNDSQEALAFFLNHDWEGDYSWHQEEQIRFVNEAVKLLMELAS